MRIPEYRKVMRSPCSSSSPEMCETLLPNKGIPRSRGSRQKRPEFSFTEQVSAPNELEQRLRMRLALPASNRTGKDPRAANSFQAKYATISRGRDGG
jgi:hypothetical protein